MKSISDDRRTKFIKGGVREISEEDLIPDTDSVLVLRQVAVKRTDPNEYKTQKRGGVGWWTSRRKREDVVTTYFRPAHSDLLFL